jgi:hypothetical protein
MDRGTEIVEKELTQLTLAMHGGEGDDQLARERAGDGPLAVSGLKDDSLGELVPPHREPWDAENFRPVVWFVSRGCAGCWHGDFPG